MAKLSGKTLEKRQREKIFTRITACYNINSMKTTMTVLFCLALFSTVSCSKEDPGQKPSGEIVKEYTKTLSTAQDKARDAGEASEQRDQKIEDTIKELDK